MEHTNFEFEYNINFELFFKLHLEPLCLINTEGELLKINDAWTRILGYSKAEIENKNLKDFIHPEDFNIVDNSLETLRSGVELISFITRYKHKDGHYALIEWRTNSKLEGFIYISATDITRYKKREEQLQADHKRLEAIIENQSNYVIRMNFDETFSYTNKKYVDTFGWLAEDGVLLGKHALLPIHEDSVEAIIEMSKRTMANPNQAFQIELRHKSNTNTPIYIIWECTALLDSDGNVYEVQGVGIDVSERRIQEEIAKTRKEFELLEMSTPITELWQGILLLPLVGIVTTQRAINLTSLVLKKITESQAKVFILDISGVSNVDTAVANHFIKLSKATRLMGCTCTISGISPAIAQTMIELGIQIEEINTTASMKDALENGLFLTGNTFISIK